MSRFFTSERVIFDELPPRLNVLAHQRGKNRVGLRNVFELDAQTASAARDPSWSPKAAGWSSRPGLCSAAPGIPFCPAPRCRQTARARSVSLPARAECASRAAAALVSTLPARPHLRRSASSALLPGLCSGSGLGCKLDQERRLEKFLDQRVLRHHLPELGA